MTRTITLSDDHWQTISDALSDFCDEGPPDSPWKSPGLEAAQAALDAALAQPEWPVQDDKTLKSIRETTPRYRMSVIVRTNDSAIDTRMIVIGKALDLSKEILESVSLPERLPPFLYSPATIAECAGGPCQQGPEYCDCGAMP
jgi:hypothetical protein